MADLRPPRVRLSRPANQRFVSMSPSRRRSPSRRSGSFRNLHEQSDAIVHPAKGRRGASCSKTRLPLACVAAAQHKRLGAIEIARKSPPVFGRFTAARGIDFFAGHSRGVLPNISANTLIMTGNNLSRISLTYLTVLHCHQEERHRSTVIVDGDV